MTADRTRWREILDKALAERDRLAPEEMEFLLELHTPEALEALFAAAYAMKIRHVGKIVRLRGLIEIGNICAKNCFYCGIRRDNTAECRFVLTRDEILEAARKILDFGYGSVVLQAGERNDRPWVDFITEVVAAIKALGDGALGITLSLGEQEAAVYRRWFEAGAHRYLLRIESSSPVLYARLHPADGKHEFESRLNALESLRRVGYQLGTGVMSGLPGQSAADLAGDIEFFRQIDADMIGMGPYLPHHATPLGRAVLETGGIDPARQLEIGLKMIAVTRLALRDVNIASTTALQALAPDGRERGLLAGANVVMPNVTATAYRANYQLYDGKPGCDENAETSRLALERAVAAIGETVGIREWGDSPHARQRNQNPPNKSVIFAGAMNMEARILSGAECAASINAETMRLAGEFTRKHGFAPALAVILVGDDPASQVYVHNKAKKCIELGLRSEKFILPRETGMAELLALIDRLNRDASIHGILVQSPPPPQIDEEAVIAAIAPAKDVDCFHPVNVGRMLIGRTDGFFPCTPYGVLKLLEFYGIDPAGKHAVVIGRSNIVGKPLLALLIQKTKGANATVTCVHSATRNLAELTRQADILIAAIGKPEFVKRSMVKPGAVVVDVGINRIPDASKKSGTRLVGDVDYADVAPVASAITPVPGGVGLMTVAILMRNTVEAAMRSI